VRRPTQRRCQRPWPPPCCTREPCSSTGAGSSTPPAQSRRSMSWSSCVRAAGLRPWLSAPPSPPPMKARMSWGVRRAAPRGRAGGRRPDPLAGDLVSGVERTAGIGGWPTTRVLQRDDVIIADLAPRVTGYWAASPAPPGSMTSTACAHEGASAAVIFGGPDIAVLDHEHTGTVGTPFRPARMSSSVRVSHSRSASSRPTRTTGLLRQFQQARGGVGGAPQGTAVVDVEDHWRTSSLRDPDQAAGRPRSLKNGLPSPAR